jgi:hypothetical protein
MMNLTVPLHYTCTVHSARSKLTGNIGRVDFYRKKRKMGRKKKNQENPIRTDDDVELHSNHSSYSVHSYKLEA